MLDVETKYQQLFLMQTQMPLRCIVLSTDRTVSNLQICRNMFCRGFEESHFVKTCFEEYHFGKIRFEEYHFVKTRFEESHFVKNINASAMYCAFYRQNGIESPDL
jgi:hypothetical protein